MNEQTFKIGDKVKLKTNPQIMQVSGFNDILNLEDYSTTPNYNEVLCSWDEGKKTKTVMYYAEELELVKSF